MPRMHLLRTSSMLARLILAWFVLTLGAAIASPLVRPQALELVCTAGSTAKLVVLGDGSPDAPSAPHGLDCPLCLHFGTPPSQAQPLAVVHPQPLAPCAAADRGCHPGGYRGCAVAPARAAGLRCLKLFPQACAAAN